MFQYHIKTIAKIAEDQILFLNIVDISQDASLVLNQKQNAGEEDGIRENTILDNIGILCTLQSHHTVVLPERIDGRAHISAEVPFFQGMDSEIHLPGVLIQRVLRHYVFVTEQQFLA